MEENKEGTKNAPATPAAGVSRRDFLRKAGTQAAKEAVTTGTYLVPGGAIARKLLENGEQNGGAAAGPEAAKPSLLGRLAGWRRKRTEEEPVAPPTETQPEGGAAS